MTLDDVQLLSNYAKKHPPLRALVQGIGAALGVKWPEPASDQPQQKPNYMTAEQLRMLLKQTGGRIDG